MLTYISIQQQFGLTCEIKEGGVNKYYEKKRRFGWYKQNKQQMWLIAYK